MMKQGSRQRDGEDCGDSGTRLAVIDDEDRWLKVFERMFRATGYRLETFSEPRMFLRTIQSDPMRYAGVICDIKMPELDGHQVFDILKQNPETASVPFVLVSGVLTDAHNLYRVQGIAHVSKLDDNLRARIFDELIEIIENWPHLKAYLTDCRTAHQDIDFFHQFYVNYHLYFGQILGFVRQMEAACVEADAGAAAQVRLRCQEYLEQLQQRCMDLVHIAQDCPRAGHFVGKVCSRARTSLNMLTHFQVLLGDKAPADSGFPDLLSECRNSLERIILGSEKGYSLRT